MTWQQNKARKERLEKVKQNSRNLHDLFFKKPISKNHTERSTASKQSSVHQHQ
jgi:hypothetical protein